MKMLIKKIRIPLKVSLRVTCHGRTVTLSRGQSWRCPSCGLTFRA